MQNSGKKTHMLIRIGVILLACLLLLFIISSTYRVFEIWGVLQQLPLLQFIFYIALISATMLFSLWVAYELLKPSSIKEETEAKSITTETILIELNQAEKIGIDVTALRSELEKLQTRKDAGTVHVALFGDVSTGKSSIIKALLPDSQLEINVCAGSTPDIQEYTWKSATGNQLTLTDLPGRNEVKGALDIEAQEEAIRAQIVIYVTDSDLTRTQYNDIQQLQNFGKPLIVALNKSDRFSDEEKDLFRERIKNYLPDQSQLVFVQSGGKEEVLKIYPDGKEETFLRDRKADISDLTKLLQNEIFSQKEILEKKRDASVFKLVKQKLATIKNSFRKEKSEAIITSSTRKAVLGAMVAITPGSDLVIQSMIGTQLLKQLCDLYDVPIRQLDINKLKKQTANHKKFGLFLILVVVGNSMKVFPVIGTLIGGLTHTVAYVLIIDFLGRAVNKTLKKAVNKNQ